MEFFLLILMWNVTWTCFLVRFAHIGSWWMDVQLKEGYMMMILYLKVGGPMIWWLFNGSLLRDFKLDMIWKSFLNLLPPKEKYNKNIASHYVFWLLFSYALHLCVSWRISAKLLCYLGSFSPPSTPFPLHFSCLVFNLSPAVVEMIDCTECGERNVFLFALLSLIQNLFLLDVPCVSKGFNTAQLCELYLL